MLLNVKGILRCYNRMKIRIISLSQLRIIQRHHPFNNNYISYSIINNVRFLCQLKENHEGIDDISKMNYCNNQMESNNNQRQYESTLRIFDMMVSENISKDSTSYIHVIEALVALRRIEEAEERLKESLDNNIREVDLFLPLFKYYCNKARSDDAVRLYKTLEDLNIHPNEEIIRNFIVLFKKINRYDKSIETFYNYKNYRDSNIGSLLYNEVLPILIQLKRYEEANKLYHDMETSVDVFKRYYTYESTLAIVTIKALYEDVDNVLYWIEEIPSHGFIVKNDHFFTAMSIYSEKNMMNEFYILFDKAHSCIGRYGFSITARHLYDSCLLKFKELRSVKLAEDFINIIKRNKHCTDDTLCYGYLSTIYLKLGDEMNARSILDRYLPKNAHKLNRSILREFFNHYASIGDYHEAMEVAYKFKFILNEKDYIFFEYSKSCFKGDVEQAKTLFYRLTENKIRHIATNINELLICFIRAKRFADGLSFFEKINSKTLILNKKTYESILRMYAEIKSYDEFNHYLEGLMNSIPFESTGRVHNAIMVAMIRAGKKYKVQDYFRENYKGLIVPNSETIEILISTFYKDVEYKDFIADLWESTIMAHNIILDVESLIKYLEFSSIFNYKEIGLCILKKLISIIGREGFIIERSQCYEIRNSMIRLRLLHQASSTWNELLEFSTQASVVMSSNETQNFSKLLDLTLSN